MHRCCTSKKKRIDLMIQNQELLRLRLTQQEKYYYTNLFYEHSINERVSRIKFPELLGLLGTDIAENFAFRIFDTFSSDKKSIQLNEYLKYFDVYHHGDENERCRVTFKLMDTSGEGQISLENFENYLNLIIAAIKKVHPGASDNLLSSKEISLLFNKISNNKATFSYTDFEYVYHKKPELLSWIDYFKNNDEDVLFLINQNLKNLLYTMESFFGNFAELMNNTLLDEKTAEFNLNPAINEIKKFCKLIENKRKQFVHLGGVFSIRTIFENLTKSFNVNDPMGKSTGLSLSPVRDRKTINYTHYKRNFFETSNDYKETKVQINTKLSTHQVIDNENKIPNIKSPVRERETELKGIP